MYRSSVILGVVYAALLLGLSHSSGTQPQQNAADALEVRCAAGLLTVVVRGVPVKDVFNAVGKQCGIAVTYWDGEQGGVMTASLPPTPVQPGIERLLDLAGVTNYTLVSQQDPDGSSVSIEQLYILSRDQSAAGSPRGQRAAEPAGTSGGGSGGTRMARAELSKILGRPLRLPLLTPIQVKTPTGSMSGVRVHRLEQDALALKAGIRPGDIILRVNDLAIDHPEALAQAYRRQQETPRGVLRYVLLRDGTYTTAYILFE